MSKADKEVLLDIRDLEVHFETRRGIARAVNKVDLTLYKGERFGLVGESGSGKTTLILALLRMIKTPGLIAGGSATLDDGTDLIQLDREQVRQARLKRVAMVPQGAMNSLNPVMRIGDQLMLTMREHAVEEQAPPKAVQMEHAIELLGRVGLKPEVARLVPPRIERRHEAAGLHCPGHLAQPTAHLSRRADLCARRGGAAANHADLAPATAPAQRHCALGRPRHGLDGAVRRARRHHVRRQIGRGGSGPKRFFTTRNIPYTQLLISSIPSFETKGEFKGIPGVGLSLLEPPSGCLFTRAVPKPCPSVASAHLPCKRWPPTT